MPASQEVLNPSHFSVDVYDSDASFSNIRDQILTLDQLCFPHTHTKRVDLHQGWFSNPQNTIVLLKDSCGIIIGFSIARPQIEGRELPTDTCNVSLTAIHPKFQKNGLARLLMEKLKTELRKRGYSFWERNLAVENGWNTSFLSNESQNIVEVGEPRMTDFGLKQYVKCSL